MNQSNQVRVQSIKTYLMMAGFFDLKEDISEENNLTETNPEKRDELLEMLEEWRKETGAPVPVELNPDYQEEE